MANIVYPRSPGSLIGQEEISLGRYLSSRLSLWQFATKTKSRKYNNNNDDNNNNDNNNTLFIQHSFCNIHTFKCALHLKQFEIHVQNTHVESLLSRIPNYPFLLNILKLGKVMWEIFNKTVQLVLQMTLLYSDIFS